MGMAVRCVANIPDIFIGRFSAKYQAHIYACMHAYVYACMHVYVYGRYLFFIFSLYVAQIFGWCFVCSNIVQFYSGGLDTLFV